MVKQLQEQEENDPVEKTKSLISALNYLSRDLLLPSHLYASVSSIYHASVSDLSPSPPLRVSCFFDLHVRICGCESNFLALCFFNSFSNQFLGVSFSNSMNPNSLIFVIFG